MLTRLPKERIQGQARQQDERPAGARERPAGGAEQLLSHDPVHGSWASAGLLVTGSACHSIALRNRIISDPGFCRELERLKAICTSNDVLVIGHYLTGTVAWHEW